MDRVARCSWSRAALTVVVIALSGCGGNDDGTVTPVTPVAPVVTGTAIGGTITGVTGGAPVVLTNNGGDALTVTGDGAFVFPSRIADGGRFSVAVATVPSGRSCVALVASGPVSDLAATRSVQVICGPAEAHAFARAADMLVAREGHRLVKLADGTIVAFGFDVSVEQYDSKRDVWTAAGTIPTGLLVVSAAVVSGTKVLLSATTGSGSGTPVALLYDSATRTTLLAPAFTVATLAPQLIALRDGRVLALDTRSTAVANSELYDPATNRWIATGSAASGVDAHTNGALVLMADGNVLYASGGGPFNTQVSTSEIYNVATGTWARTGDTRVAREFGVPVLLPNGRVLLVGGQFGVFSARTNSGPFFAPQAEVYDPSSQQWFLAGVVYNQGFNLTATLMPSGKVLLVGGNSHGSTGFKTTPPTSVGNVDAYDPSTNTISPWGTMNQARTLHASTLTNEGKLLVTGGEFSPLNDPNDLFGGFTRTVLRSSEVGY